MTMNAGEAARQRQQTKAFLAWCNSHLKKRGTALEDFVGDLSSGIKLILLVEQLSGDKLGKYNKNPKIRIEKVENLNVALNHVREGRARQDVVIPLVEAALGDVDDKEPRLAQRRRQLLLEQVALLRRDAQLFDAPRLAVALRDGFLQLLLQVAHRRRRLRARGIVELGLYRKPRDG